MDHDTQPYLHDLISCVHAPSVVIGGADGQLRHHGVHGWLRDDRRLLSRLELRLDDVEPEPVGHALFGAAGARFTAVVRHLGDPHADPTVRLERSRQIGAGQVRERFELVNDARVPVHTTLTVRLGADLCAVAELKQGRARPMAPITVRDGTLEWGDETTVRTSVDPSPEQIRTETEGASLSWRVTVPSHERWCCELRFDIDPVGLFSEPADQRALPGSLRSGSPDLDRLFERSRLDLSALRLSDPDRPRDVFLAAGSPWFFTLFGRDSLWTARMLLPLGTEIAAGTLRVLARRQGSRHDPETAERPGRIPHEVRRPSPTGDELPLPPLYYGTIDATPLWVVLLAEAWRWGMAEAEVRALLPNLQAALDWIIGPADEDEDGFLDYLDVEGNGLANQGWKDSGDSIQWPDGRIAEPPISLCEAQAYAYQAAVAGADLLDAFGTDGHRYRQWAQRLRTRFRDSFWVEDADGRFPALALDGRKRPVPSVTSNLGHLLGTGLLDEHESALVAGRLAGHDLDSGHGLRTMSTSATGFNPLGYHTGSVWPHDTAIAVRGLSLAGASDTAASLADGLVRAAAAFDHRMPELYGGTDAHRGDPALAYPAACRPQAWSAAAVFFLVRSALRLEVDIPAGTLHLDPDPAFAHWFPLDLGNLRLAGHPLHVRVDSSGLAFVRTSAPVRLLGQCVRGEEPR